MRAPSGASLTKAIPHPDDLEHLESRLRDQFLEVIHEAGETAATRFSHFANQETHPAALTAAPGVGPSTAMVAVYPTDEQAAAMRQPNGEDSAILHVTLAFLGELEPDRAEMAAGVARKVASANQALSGSVGGVGAFGDNGAGHPSILLPDVVGLAELRHAVCTALCDAGIHFIGCQCPDVGNDPSRAEHGFNPHMTLGYHDELTVPPKHLLGRPLDFGQLSFAQGDVRRDFDFAAEGDWVLPALGVSEPVYVPITRAELDRAGEDEFLRSLGAEMAKPLSPWTADERAWLALGRTIPINGVPRGFALTAGAVVAESETGIEIGNVAKAHAEAAAPDYGDTYWNEVEQTVFWISADWTSIDEADAAIADFLAIDDVQNVEECAECGPPAGDGWEKVYTSSSVDLPADELPEENALVAAAPPWTQPHPDELVDVESLVARFRGKSDPVRRAAVEAAAAPALEKAGLSFDATNPFIDNVVAGIGQHVTYIADTTRLNVMRIVRRSYEDGLSIPDTAKAIREGMAAAAGSRATLIARTEMTSLVNGGGLAAMNVVTDAGVGTYLKRWLTAPGASYPRHEDYDGLDGQTVALNGVFDVGGASLAYPGDPDGPVEEVANCRCTLIYVESGQAAAGDITGEEGVAVEPEDFAVAAPPPDDTISVGTSDFVPALVVRKIKELGLDRRLEDLTPTSKIGREVYARGKDTAALYKPGGEWSPDRAALHDKIVAAYFDGKIASGERTVYFTAGGGASGKSAAIFNVAGRDVGLKELGARNDTIWIDPDRIKAMLPEYNQLRDAGDFYAANGVHEESSELAKRIQAEAQRRGFSVILDTTGSSSTFVQKLEAAKAAGYDVKVTMFSIPTNEAIVRSMARAEKKGGASEGRYVSIEALKNAHAGASRQMAIWKDSPAVSEWRVYDNTGKEPTLVAHGGTDVAPKVLDQNTFDSIIGKASEAPGSRATVAPSAAPAEIVSPTTDWTFNAPGEATAFVDRNGQPVHIGDYVHGKLYGDHVGVVTKGEHGQIEIDWGFTEPWPATEGKVSLSVVKPDLVSQSPTENGRRRDGLLLSPEKDAPPSAALIDTMSQNAHESAEWYRFDSDQFNGLLRTGTSPPMSAWIEKYYPWLNAPSEAQARSIIDQITAAANPIKGETTVYRMYSADDDLYKALTTEGSIISDKAFMSTTTVKRKALVGTSRSTNEERPVRVELRVPDGTPMVWMDHPEVSEALLLPGSRFRITSIGETEEGVLDVKATVAA